MMHSFPRRWRHSGRQNKNTNVSKTRHLLPPELQYFTDYKRRKSSLLFMVAQLEFALELRNEPTPEQDR
jgi:hypothetical protein